MGETLQAYSEPLMLTTSGIFQQSYVPGSLICWSIGVQNYVLSDKLKEAGMFSVFSNNIFHNIFFPHESLKWRIASEILEVFLMKEWDYWDYQVCSPCLISSYIYIAAIHIHMYIYTYVYIWINSLWKYKLFPFLMLFTTVHYVVECDSLYPQI